MSILPDHSPLSRRRLRRVCLALLLAYGALLVASSVTVWLVRDDRRERSAAGVPHVELQAMNRDGPTTGRVRVAYSYLAARNESSGPVVLLLHGSPGNRGNFDRLADLLAERRNVLAPDLPGFGESTYEIPDYSAGAHARHVLELLDRLGIEQVDTVGFSMGGGVLLELYRIAPERLRSVVLLSSVGVQELELFGSYRLNHLIHGVQLQLLRWARWLVPHFGLLDGPMSGRSYARNFYDTDQRSLRGILSRLEPPTLILHGRDDFLIPTAAAREHHRIVPQSELWLEEGGHFLLFRTPGAVGARIDRFLVSVDGGTARARAQAAPDRLREAGLPFDPRTVPPWTGVGLALIVVLLALSTLVSEDLACIGAGLLAGQGRIEFLPAVLACIAGIFVGDMMLFVAGRLLGRPALRRPPLRWLVSPEQVEICSRWFNERGPVVVGLSRFVPGMRLPTYFAAGTLQTGFWSFAGWFGLAVVLWTPLLVGVSSLLGEHAFVWFERFQRHGMTAAILFALWILAVVKLLLPLATHRGRRRLLGKFRRWRHWEFWPPWLVYLPVIAWVLWLGLRYRSPFLFTAANPGIEAGGFIAESKDAILRGLAGAGERIAAHERLSMERTIEERVAAVDAFMKRNALDWPVVLKPDAGQRGSGVSILRNEGQLEERLRQSRCDMLVQAFAAGQEFGVFYYRIPGEPRGRIFSITEKRIPTIEGDGRRTLEELILDDDRAICMLDTYLHNLAGRLGEVPAAGSRVPLVEIGTHCRGAIFLDGGCFRTAELEQAIDEVSRSFPGFWFGRYDLRVESEEDLVRGRRFRVIELNGVTSEATHIYDPTVSLSEAYRVLFGQWELAFRIGAGNRAAGAEVAGAFELIRLIFRYRRLAGRRPE